MAAGAMPRVLAKGKQGSEGRLGPVHGRVEDTGHQTGVEAHAFSGLLHERQNFVLQKVHVLTSHHGIAKNGC